MLKMIKFTKVSENDPKNQLPHPKIMSYNTFS